MKLTKRDRKLLESVFSDLRRGQTYIMQPSVHVCKEYPNDSTTLVFTRAYDGMKLTDLDKEIGSELALLHTGVNRLKTLLWPETC
jgi:hypothetical protein